MQPSTIEKALHEWLPWGESIASARLAFSYLPLPSGQQLREWQWHYYRDVFVFGQEELKRLGLPESAVYYWLACFYSNYLKSDGSIEYDNIKDVLFASNGEFGDKAYPLLFCYTATIGAST